MDNETLDEQSVAVNELEETLIENAEVDKIKKVADPLKVGQKTTFGVITKRGDDWIEFKAKDTPKTKIKYSQRKIGGAGYVLKFLKLVETVNEQAPHVKYRNDDIYAAAASILNPSN